MNKTKHTPGPWNINEDTQNVFQIYTKKKTVAWTSEAEQETGNYKKSEADANARLIAAAPDLLEACKSALEEIEEYKERTGKHFASANLLAGSIDKAEGR